MALQPGLILAGQQFDLAGSMGAGNQLAAQTNQLRDQNALRDVYRTQGAGILQGNQGSLNALAAVDPAQAMQMQAGQLDMQATRQRMDMLSREEQRQLAAAKASMTAAEAAAAAAQIEDAVKMGLAIQDPAQWDAVMAQQAPDLVGQFNNRQSLAMKYMSMAEVLKANAPPEAMNPSDRFKVVGSSLFDLAAEGGPAPIGQGAMPEETIFGPDGKPIMVRGGAGANTKFTEGQSRDNVYATRAEGALAKLEPVAGALTGRAGKVGEMLGGVTMGLSRELLQSDDYQVAKNAGDEYLQAILRKDTGAAITTDEQLLYGVTYLPQPGDKDAVLQAKAEARVRALEAIRAGMSVDQLATVARAERAAIERLAAQGDQPAPQGAPQPGPAADFSQMDMNGLAAVDVMTLDAAGLDAFEARMNQLTGGN